jgi:FAD/FMN-containing dehydrogenase
VDSTELTAREVACRLLPLLSATSEVITEGLVFITCKSDESGIPGDAPLCVVRPASVDDVRAVVNFCRENGISIAPRGGGTGLEGGAVPLGRCLVLDTSSLDQIIKICPDERMAYVGAGVTAARLNHLVGEHGLFFATAPAGSAESATIGGLISTNAKGMYSLRYGSASDSVCGVDVVLADGSCSFFGHRVRHSSSGYDMKHLFAGAEGTIGIIVSAIVKLIPLPPLKVASYSTFSRLSDAAAFCADVAAWVPEAAAIELVSSGTVKSILKVLPGCGLPPADLVMIEIHADPEAAENAALILAELAFDRAGVPFLPGPDVDPWEIRHRFTGIISEQSKGGHPFRFDAAVPTTALEQYVTAVELAAAELNPGITCIFGHGGAGIVHVLLPVGGKPGQWTPEQATDLKTFALESALELNGTVSGEHGIGLTSITEAAIENATSIKWMKAIKALFDPTNMMNPGKLLG